MDKLGVIVAMGPLPLINSLECARELEISRTNLMVLFSGKTDNLDKLAQARRICRDFGLDCYVHLRIRPSYWLRNRRFRIFRMIGRAFARVEDTLNEATYRVYLRWRFPSNPPKYFIGGGDSMYLDMAKKYAADCEVYIVDSGIEAIWGSKSNVRLRDQISTGQKVFTSFSPESLGIPTDLVVKNNHSLLLERISALPVCEQTALFVSTNDRSLWTNAFSYNQAIAEARSRHKGNLIYYRRGNESRSSARIICQRHDLNLVDIEWPVELYIFMQLGCVPGKIFSAGSSALWFFRKVQEVKGNKVFYIVLPEVRAKIQADILEHRKENAGTRGLVEIIEN